MHANDVLDAHGLMQHLQIPVRGTESPRQKKNLTTIEATLSLPLNSLSVL